MTETTDTTRIPFMCVQNAGRSQMSTAFAEREREERGLEDSVDVRDRDLDDPDGEDTDRVREIRDEIERRVAALFDEIGDDVDDTGD